LNGVGRGISRRFAAVPTAVFVVMVLTLPFLFKGDAGLATDRFPVATADALADAPVFHNDVVGGYLIWDRGPDLQVFIDDRAELYKEQMQEYVDVRSGNEPWEPVFERYGINQALLRDTEPMVRWLDEAGWVATAEEDGFVLLTDG
jgi:hypothetical protein